MKNRGILTELETLRLTNDRAVELNMEATEKLHETNRYRHELEVRYKAEKLGHETLQDTVK